MEGNLEQCIEGYYIEDQPIQPISKVDADIILQLKKTAYILDESLYMILIDYKEMPDEQILNLLIQWNSEHKSSESKKRDFILFESETLPVDLIHSIGKKSIFNFQEEEGKYEYFIIVNEGHNDKFHFGNRMYKFKNERERDEKFVELHELMQKTNKINFI